MASSTSATVFRDLSLPSGLELATKDEAKGRGLYSTRSFEVGAVVLADERLVGIQTLDSRRHVPTCQYCFGFLGSLELQISLLANRINPSVLATETPVDKLNLPSLPKCPTKLLPITRCGQGCGQIYCSEECRARAWTSGHNKLCIGLIQDLKHPLIQFKIHAMEHNEVFLQVAAVLVFIMNEVEIGQVTLEKALERFPFCKGLWWDIVRSRQPVNLAGEAQKEQEALEEDLKADILQMTSASLSLLTQALNPSPEFASLFTYDFYSSIVGMFEYNQLGIELESPVARYYRVLFGPQVDQDIETDPEGKLASARNKMLYAIKDIEHVLTLEDDGCGSDCSSDDEPEEKEKDQEGQDPTTSALPWPCAVCTFLNPGQSVVCGACEMPKEGVDEEEEEVERDTGNSGPLDDIDIRHVLQPFDGQALFPRLCFVNHSCEANCRVMFSDAIDDSKEGTGDEPVSQGESKDQEKCAESKEGDIRRGGLVARLTAIRPIALGEEITFSYLNKEVAEKETPARRKWLFDYGFVCQCDRCGPADLTEWGQ